MERRVNSRLAQVATVALDPWRGYASALVAPLGHATVVVDHFHAIRLANLVVDQVRRRVQQATALQIDQAGHPSGGRDPGRLEEAGLVQPERGDTVQARGVVHQRGDQRTGVLSAYTFTCRLAYGFTCRSV